MREITTTKRPPAQAGGEEEEGGRRIVTVGDVADKLFERRQPETRESTSPSSPTFGSALHLDVFSRERLDDEEEKETEMGVEKRTFMANVALSSTGKTAKSS